MKKLIFLLIAINLFAYEACEKTKSEAINSLAKQIFTKVDISYNKSQQQNNDTYKQNISYTTSQKTSLNLKNIKFTHKNNLICASISKEEIQKEANNTLLSLKAFNADTLPKDFKVRNKIISQTLTKIAFVKSILNLDTHELKYLNNLQIKLQKKLNQGAVKFIAPKSTTIILDNKIIYPNQTIYLPAGKHFIKAVANNKCPINEPIVIEKNKYITKEINLKSPPTIVINSNKPNAKVLINSKPYKVGQKVKLSCDTKKVIYSISYEENSKNGEIDIKPGDNKEIYQSFLSQRDIKLLNNLSQKLVEGHSFELALKWSKNFHNKKYDKRRFIQITHYNNLGAVRLNIKALLSAEHFYMKSVDYIVIAGGIEYQLSHIKNIPLHIGLTPVIPYIGISYGKNIYQNNFDSALFYEAGANIAINKYFSININYQKEILFDKSHLFGIGLVANY